MKLEAVCNQCDQPFTARQADQRFCCTHCRMLYHNKIKSAKLRFATQKGFDPADPEPKKEDLFS